MRQLTSRFRCFAVFALSLALVACADEDENTSTASVSHSNADTVLDVDVMDDTAQQCEASQGDLTLNAHRIALSGRLTRNGQATNNLFGHANPYLVNLHFVEQISQASTVVPLNLSNEGQYDVILGVGTYDIHIYGISQEGESSLASEVSLAKGMALTESQRLDFDLETAVLSGVVTLNGASFPEPPEGQLRGHVMFHRIPAEESTALWSAALATGGEAEFSVELPRDGEYDMWWLHAGDLQGAPISGVTNAVPFGAVHLGRWNADMPQSGVFDVQGTPGEVVGSVTAGGGALPGDPSVEANHTAFLSINKDGWNVVRVALGPEQRNTYNIQILTDTYDVSLITGDEAVGRLPSYGYADICKTCMIGDMPAYNIDLARTTPDEPLTPVRGTVRLDGMHWPPAGLELTDAVGTLHFESLDGEASQGFHSSGQRPAYQAAVDADGAFAVDLKTGMYRVSFSSVISELKGASVLMESWTVDGPVDGLNLTADVVRFQGELLVNGQTLADDGLIDNAEYPYGTGRGVLRLGNIGNLGVVHFELGEVGPALLESFVLAGTYTATLSAFHSEGRTHIAPDSQDVLPVGFRAIGNVVIAPDTESQRHMLDASVHRVEGILDEVGVGNDLRDYESYILRFVDAQGSTFWTSAPADGGAFDVLLYDGVYTIDVGAVDKGQDADSYPAHLMNFDNMGRSATLGTICVGSVEPR